MRPTIDDLNKGLTDIMAPWDTEPWNESVKQAHQMPVGDLESDERGSGARANADKLRVELIPVRAWVHHFAGKAYGSANSDVNVVALYTWLNLLDDLADFQEGKITGKQLLAHVPPSWMDAAVDVFVYGIKKYKMWNWLKGQPWSVPLASAVRHAKAVLTYFPGEGVDKESGCYHNGMFVANLIMLATFYYTYPEGNDMPDKKFFGESDG